jgi:hypothetical protein
MSSLSLVAATTPQVQLSVVDRSRPRNPQPVDVSAGTTVVKLRVRARGTTTPVVEIVCIKQTGKVELDGSINTAAPYDVAGRGGRVVADCAASVFPTAGIYEGEVVVEFGATNRKTIPYDLLAFKVRAPT